MEDWVVSLAKEMKKRDNPSIPTITVGKVISPMPSLKVQLEDGIVLYTEHLIIPEGIIEKEYIAITETHSYTIKLKFELKEDDEVILLPTTNGQTYVVLDRVYIK